MAYTSFDIAKAAKSYELDCAGALLSIVKVKTSRWLLCKEDGTVVSSKRSETDVLQIAEKIEMRRIKGNLHGYRFGSRVGEAAVMQYAKEVWAERFSYSEVVFDGHYWWADITENETGRTAKHLRLDYHINYERLPEFA